jgi:hypothetical protein
MAQRSADSYESVRETDRAGPSIVDQEHLRKQITPNQSNDVWVIKVSAKDSAELKRRQAGSRKG